jgi:preprotein translocase subunit SecF
MLLFVGASIQNFAVVMLIGVIAGTFSSVCIAPNLLVVWEEGKWSNLFKRNRNPQPAAEAKES